MDIHFLRKARIDLDQMAIINLLEFGDFAAAEAIYQKGSHSKSMSNLTLAEPLTIDIPQGANLVGESTSGKMVQVFAQAQSYAPGATYILVQYKDEDCYAGANPKPVVTGCLVARGNLTEETTGMSIAYQYEPTSSYNLYSIQYFTKGTEFIFEKGGNFTVDFQKFVDFYGSDNYADDIITAAFQGRSTNFSTGKNVDASVLRNDGRARALIWFVPGWVLNAFVMTNFLTHDSFFFFLNDKSIVVQKSPREALLT